MTKKTWRPDFSNPLPDLLREIRHVINEVLEIALPMEWGGRANLKAPALYSLHAGGKRIRPSLVLLSAYACCRGPLLATLPFLRAACSVELIHTYSLIHDDLPCMDDDDTRRGMPTCHVRFGLGPALWAGSSLLVEGFRLLSSALSGTGSETDAVSILGQASGFGGMVGGQWLDLSTEGEFPTRQGVAEIHMRKTAALFTGCCGLGSLLGGATDHEQKCLEEYGAYIGQAFQAVDDLLDIEGREEMVGKRTGKDQDAGKMTITELLGVSGARSFAEDLVDRAAASVRNLDGPAVPSLMALGSRLVSRTY